MSSVIKQIDPEVYDLIEAEKEYQASTIRLIASENTQLPETSEAMGCVYANKYSEGYPHKWKKGELVLENARYYQGQMYANKLETLTIQRCLSLFAEGYEQDYHANVQPLSGAPANLAVLSGLMDTNDTLLGLELASGGHLSHGHHVTISGKVFDAQTYTLNEQGLLDYDLVRERALATKPKVIICGYSAYPRTIDFKIFADIAKEVGAYLLSDISHFSGLVAGGAHPSPIPHSDIVMTTTHKSLRGPRSAVLICRKELGKKIDQAVFPHLQGGPHMHAVAAMATTFKVAKQDDFKEYAAQIVKNAKRLAEKLTENGFHLVSGGTDNHLILADLSKGATAAYDIDGTVFCQAAEDAGLIFNKNSVPGDTKPMKPSGFRIGTPAVTTVGMKEDDMEFIANSLAKVAENCDNPEKLSEIREQVKEFMKSFPAP